MKQGWYSGYEVGTGNVAGVKVGYESDNTLRAEQARGYWNGRTIPTLPASCGRMSVTVSSLLAPERASSVQAAIV